MSQTEITFDEWNICALEGGCSRTNPFDSGWGRSNRPVGDVSWFDAQEYVSWLSDKTGHEYRLPSESEWEYAARAGTTQRFNTGDCISPDQANFNGFNPAQGCLGGIFRDKTLPVGSFSPNSFGLFDMHGNVYEWVQDCWNWGYQGAPVNGEAWMTGNCSQAVLRGGNYRESGAWQRSASRRNAPRLARAGFRVARTVGH